MSKRWWASLVVGLGLSTVAGSAAADPMTHDGFYFRGAVGLGYFKSSMSVSGYPGLGLDSTASGLDIGFDAWFGGSPVPGLAIGGGLTTYDVPKPSVKVGGQSVPSSNHLTLSMIGAFADYYFDPNRGLHAEALLGFGILSEQDGDGNSSSNDPSGLAMGVGFGNDWWVSDEWSIGVLGRFIYAPLRYSAGGITEKFSTITPSLMATFTFN